MNIFAKHSTLSPTTGLYVVLFALGLSLGSTHAQAQTNSCIASETRRIGSTSLLFPNDSHTFSQFVSSPNLQLELINNVQRCTSSRYSVSGNTVNTTSRCVGDFRVTGTLANCTPTTPPTPTPTPTPTTGLNLSQTPFEASVQVEPNILLIVDNSNTMVENVNGSVAASCDPGLTANCIAGSIHPESKSEIIRGVARGLVQDYENRVNLGLMAYQQHPLRASSSNDGGSISTSIQRWSLFDRIYDVSYSPLDYDASFSGNPWNDTKKRFRIPNPVSAGNFIHFNVRVPGYSSASVADSKQDFCITTESGTNWQNEPFGFNCYSIKTGTSNSLNVTTGGYSSLNGGTSGNLNDSARARGVTNWGQRMVALPYNRTEWVTIGSPGKGYLHIPIAPLDATHKDKILTKIATSPNPNTTASLSTSLPTDPNTALINAGLTPLEGTLYTARDYLKGLTGTSNFGTAQGSGNATTLPNSCDNDAAIWLTDGMPSVSQNGTPLGANTAQALADAVAAATSFHSQSGADLYVVGFAMPPTVAADSLTQLANAGNTPEPFLATDASGLNIALRSIFEAILADTQLTSTSAAVSSSRASSSTNVFLSEYTSQNWSGRIRAQNFATQDLAWDSNITYRTAITSTPIYSRNSSTNAAIQLNPNNLTNLSAAQQAALNVSPISNATDGRAADRIRWLYGQTPTGMRSRNNTEGNLLPMGDIVGSTPNYFGGRQYFGNNILSGTEGSSYSSFANSNRFEAIYVGANDGKLHALNATTGAPLFAYMPSELLLPQSGSDAAQINTLMNPSYTHRYFVNGNTTIRDAYIGGAWKSVLVGTMGAGGKTVFALDVTNPSTFSSSNVLWEFTHADLGYGVNDVAIVRLKSGQWAAVFGNGYNSTNHGSSLFVVNLSDGSLIRKIDAGSGTVNSPNGLAPALTTDWSELNLITNFAYAGDLKGNLWNFDLRNANPANWTARLVFTATDASDAAQPITSRPQIAAHPTDAGKIILLFGTGSYFRVGDNILTGSQTQSLYGIVDTATGMKVNESIEREDLLAQTIAWQGTRTFGAYTYELRQVSNNTPLANTTLYGWYLDLDRNLGERVISTPILPLRGESSRVTFNTLIPLEGNDPVCDPPTRSGFVMTVNPLTGARLQRTIYDLNKDGNFDSGDTLSDHVAQGLSDPYLSGVRFGSGEQSTSILDDGVQTLIDGTGETLDLEDEVSSGRVSWQELR